MKFLLIGDLHGQKPKLKTKDFDAIIAPGDFCSDKIRKYYFQAMKKQQKNPTKKISLDQFISKERISKLKKQSLQDGRKILQYLNSLKVPVYTVPGNWEQDEKTYKKLIKGLKNIINTHHKIIKAKDLSFIGHGFISGPEFPQEKDQIKQFPKKELYKVKKEYLLQKKKLTKLFQSTKTPIIFLPHNVPYNTKLDKITDKKSPRYGHHYGSIIARELIEKYKPLLTVGGHMHEHYGQCKIGKSIIINAGFGPQRNTLVEISNSKIKSIKYL